MTTENNTTTRTKAISKEEFFSRLSQLPDDKQREIEALIVAVAEHESGGSHE